MSKMLKKTKGPGLHKRYRDKIEKEIHGETYSESDILKIQDKSLNLPGTKMGRPLAIPTDEDQKAILEYVRRGGKVSLAFERAGLSKTTLYTWFRNAENGEEECIDFFRALAMEVAEFEIKLIERVMAGGSGVNGVMHLLQKVAPERWGDDAIAAMIKAAKGEAKTGTVNQTSVHIYLPDNGRGGGANNQPRIEEEIIDITPGDSNGEN